MEDVWPSPADTQQKLYRVSIAGVSLSCLRTGGSQPKGPAPEYLDGEPAKAIFEVQRSLVSSKGNGILSAQLLKLLLVVDHKNLPENIVVRVQRSFPAGQGGPEELTLCFSGRSVKLAQNV